MIRTAFDIAIEIAYGDGIGGQLGARAAHRVLCMDKV
jgi:hypothetical protein